MEVGRIWPQDGSQEYRLNALGIGSYMIRWDGPDRRWNVYLNGTKTKYYGDTLKEAMGAIERTIRAHELK